MNIISRNPDFVSYNQKYLKPMSYKIVGVRNIGEERDEFVNMQNSPFFTSVNAEMATLRKYADVLGNAYSDEKFFSKQTYDFIMARIKNMRSDYKAFNFLAKYKDVMDGVELKVLKFFINKLNQYKTAKISEVIEEQLPKSYKNLHDEYAKNIYELKMIVSEMQDSKKKLRAVAVLDSWENDLHFKNYESAIASEKYINIFSKMKFSKQEDNIKEMIASTLDKLPSCSEDFDAFIVKYKDVSRRKFFKALIEPFMVSIEHVIPKSRGGHASSIGNCILVRAKDNQKRGSERMLAKHPERKNFLIEYFKRVVEKINEGGMSEIQWYPFEVKKSIEAETLNKVNLDKELELLKISEEEAYKSFIA